MSFSLVLSCAFNFYSIILTLQVGSTNGTDIDAYNNVEKLMCIVDEAHRVVVLSLLMIEQ